jgi:hypothetical protein
MQATFAANLRCPSTYSTAAAALLDNQNLDHFAARDDATVVPGETGVCRYVPPEALRSNAAVTEEVTYWGKVGLLRYT